MRESMSMNLEREAQERRRRERLAASLRENLKRRKAQQRGRATPDAPAGPAPDPIDALGAEEGTVHGSH